MSERGKPAGNSIHIGKGFPRLLAEKNCSEGRFALFRSGKKEKARPRTGKVSKNDEIYALSIFPERRQRVHTYTSSTPPVVVLTLTF